jgi:pyruvate,water dikinase
VAVRSSATAEDLADLSFAGQQDTYLNIMGPNALEKAVVKCWASLWTARAIGYRARAGIAPDDVALAVVVQQQIPSEVSGVLFTANPLTGNREEVAIDATFGLGEALVSGQVEPDHYVVGPDGDIRQKVLGSKAVAIHGDAAGGTSTTEAGGDARERQALPDEAIRELAVLGRRVAGVYGAPQDIEWARADDTFYLVQSRPITSLYPLPEGADASDLHFYFSFASVQGVLEPFTPLGQDAIPAMICAAARIFGLRLTPATFRGMRVAGERLFLDITTVLRHPLGRRLARAAMGLIDPSARQVLDQILLDPRLAVRHARPTPEGVAHVLRGVGPIFLRVARNMLRPSARYRALRRRIERELRAVSRQAGAVRTPAEQVAFFDEMLDAGVRILPRYPLPGIITGMMSLGILNRLASGLPNSTRITLELTRGLPHNVTTEMDLTLWESARQIQADPQSIALFAKESAEALAARYQEGTLPSVAQQGVRRFLERYGMRGVGEIDLGRPRWRENPLPVFQVLQSYVQITDPAQAPDAQFARGAQAAEAGLVGLAEELSATRGGKLKARLVRFFGVRMRTFAGLREMPKFVIIRLFGMARNALLAAGQSWTEAGILAAPDDVFYLHLDEVRALAAGEVRDWQALVRDRRAVYVREMGRRQIPRVLLSDGRAFYAGLGEKASADGSLTGSPVSPGVVEGTVRVILDPHGAQLAPGEILVCPATDPGWTPLFLAAGGLVMEIGGMMTHGAVVAREYGIPAVVGVHDATQRLKTGQRIRVDGSTGVIVPLEV